MSALRAEILQIELKSYFFVELLFLMFNDLSDAAVAHADNVKTGHGPPVLAPLQVVVSADGGRADGGWADAGQRGIAEHPLVEQHVTLQDEVDGVGTREERGERSVESLPTIGGAADGGEVGTVFVVEAQGDAAISLQKALQLIGCAIEVNVAHLDDALSRNGGYGAGRAHLGNHVALAVGLLMDDAECGCGRGGILDGVGVEVLDGLDALEGGLALLDDHIRLVDLDLIDIDAAESAAAADGCLEVVGLIKQVPLALVLVQVGVVVTVVHAVLAGVLEVVGTIRP